ncbi:hypothetical protein EDB92DRAFT_1263398 [Lactarius akahatsu]|uniref:Secreted protein n=1 Tax=Lactarius akahatsu TaxID=416441 RepID=A0AAD4LG78_9AGAM|nr:hypothetical protein EDB92DRAFT_1263398 [Lactarius akahatsu]
MVRLPFVSLLGLQGALALSTFSPRFKREADAVPFVNPTLAGGSLLDRATPTLGEPLNVIISGLSSPGVLSDAGFLTFVNAIGFATECLGIHIGDPQAANLGDGHGYVNQTIELRQDFGNVPVGSCLESLAGGNHLRLFRQNGPTANTGALFLAVSQEENVFEGHTISPDGYDIGRDKFVQGALGASGFHTVAQNITGLLAPGSTGINHGIATDGVVVLLTVTTA